MIRLDEKFKNNNQLSEVSYSLGSAHPDKSVPPCKLPSLWHAGEPQAAVPFSFPKHRAVYAPEHLESRLTVLGDESG